MFVYFYTAGFAEVCCNGGKTINGNGTKSNPVETGQHRLSTSVIKGQNNEMQALSEKHQLHFTDKEPTESLQVGNTTKKPSSHQDFSSEDIVNLHIRTRTTGVTHAPAEDATSSHYDAISKMNNKNSKQRLIDGMDFTEVSRTKRRKGKKKQVRLFSNEYYIKKMVLRKDYDKTTRPVRNDSATMSIFVGMSLYHILDTVSFLE